MDWQGLRRIRFGGQVALLYISPSESISSSEDWEAKAYACCKFEGELHPLFCEPSPEKRTSRVESLERAALRPEDRMGLGVNILRD
jgi:hypothetical protein